MKIILGESQDKLESDLICLQSLIDKIDDTELYVDLTNIVDDIKNRTLDGWHLMDIQCWRR